MESRNGTDALGTGSSMSSRTERDSERKTPSSPSHLRNNGRPPVLHSGEEITAKNTLQSNSVVQISRDPPDATNMQASNKNATREVFANACLLDEEDGIVPIPPILIDNPTEPNQAARPSPVTAAVTRAHLSQKWIPCLLICLLVTFGAGAAAGICGSNMCTRSTKPSQSDRASTATDSNATVDSPSTPSPETNTTRVPMVAAPARAPVAVPALGQPSSLPPLPPPEYNERTMDIVAYVNDITLLGQAIPYPADPNGATPLAEALALQWIIESDPLQLAPDTVLNQFRLRQRYALRTLWVQQSEARRGVLAWDQDDECEWWGITCTTIELNDIGTVWGVTSIILNQSGLSGRLSAEFGLLSLLEKVDLWRNQIGGTLPSALGTLTNLVHFSVDTNSVSGTIPEAFGQWTGLQYFSVSYNAMTGSLPVSIGAWTSIGMALFAENDLNGTVPEGLCSNASATELLFDCSCDTVTLTCTLDVECSCCETCYNEAGFTVPVVEIVT